MKQLSLMGCAGLAVGAVLALAAPAGAQAETESILLELNRQLTETQILEQDPTFLRSISDESYVVVAPGGVIESREQVIAGLRAFAAVDSISIEKEGVVQSGATAVVLNRLVIHGPLREPGAGRRDGRAGCAGGRRLPPQLRRMTLVRSPPAR